MPQAQRVTRRDEYAAATRQAILDAARKLFAERGYFATKVDDIAAKARVAPATVYAVTGGKSGLLTELIRTWTTDPIVETATARMVEMTDPASIVRELAAGSRRMREQYADIMRVILATAPHDEAVAKALADATLVYRTAFVPIAERLAKLGALRRGIDVAAAIDLFWFYFGYTAYFTLHDDNGWSYERAEHWLADQACRELLSESRKRPGTRADTPRKKGKRR
jgi:AcrR family transcriptional regulator